jgi:hypothetical protein
MKLIGKHRFLFRSTVGESDSFSRLKLQIFSEGVFLIYHSELLSNDSESLRMPIRPGWALVKMQIKHSMISLLPVC